MLFRFSVYGFLKNQQYYEPFLFLALLEKGMTFFLIGLLIGFREICINLLEIPSGVIADLYGRRRSMIFSFISYIISFLIFSFSKDLWQLFIAMLFFSFGETFRSGTHKSMIFKYLEINGRLDERIKVYGFTRSWSKIGSAVSAIIAGALVFYSGNYSNIFLFCTIPYILSLINFLGYPPELENKSKTEFSVKKLFLETKNTITATFKNNKLRKTLIESMSFDGYIKTSKDYLQPIVSTLALTIPIMTNLKDNQKTAITIAIVYFILYMFSAIASRSAARFKKIFNGEKNAEKIIWAIFSLTYLSLIVFLTREYYLLCTVSFIIILVLQNIWRPIHLSRIDKNSTQAMGASILSIESQVKSLITIILAPVIGYLVDSFGFSVIGILGSIIGLIFFIQMKKKIA